MYDSATYKLNAAARLEPDDGVRTEGVIFDARTTVPVRRLRTPFEKLAALMGDLRHESAVAYPDLAEWIDDLAMAGKRPTTLYNYTREIARLLRECPSTAFVDFEAAEIKRLILTRPERSRHITRSILNGWFDWGVMQDKLDHSPMRKVPKVKHPHRIPRDIFDEAEIARLEALPTRDGALLTIMLGCGLRQGGCRTIRLRDIDLDRRRMTVTEKGNKTRVVPFPPEVARAIADLALTEGLDPDDHLWYSRPGGGHRVNRATPIGTSTFDHWWHRVIEAAGVRYLNPHQTRHTYQSRLQQRRVPIEYRRFLLGHEKISTTEDQYGRTSVEDAQTILDEVWA